MFKETLSNLGEVLISPKTVFEKENYSKTSIGTLILLFFIVTLLTGFLAFSITNHEGVREFQIEMSVNQALKMMPGTSAEDEQALRESVREQMNNPVTRITSYVSLILGGAFGLAMAILLFWAFMNVVLRFAGGEETAVQVVRRKGLIEKKHRNSYILSFYRYLPLVIGGILSSILLLTRSGDSLYNIASLEDLTRKMTVNLTLYALLFEGSLPKTAETILNILTSPFWWWSGWITVEGMKKVWKIPARKAVIIFLLWAVLVILSQLGIYAFTSIFTA